MFNQVAKMKTLIVDIKRNALDDGPGIRTLIFFKGCPLSCVWCQNPEAKSVDQQISFEKQNCTQCNNCVDSCNLGAIDLSKRYPINIKTCNLCGKCIEACKTEALKLVGKEYDINELNDIILKDKIFYDNSGGGVTFSGGEPTFHMKYLSELLKLLKQNQIHTCLETCGYYDKEKFEKLILPYLDLVYFDLKIYNSEKHQYYCKKSNKKILENFETLIEEKLVEVLPRIPLVPKITATLENLENLANYLKSHSIKKVGLLPYNPLWLPKLKNIGMISKYTYSKWLESKEKEEIREIFSDFKFKNF